MIFFRRRHRFAEVLFHIALDDAVVAERGAPGRQDGKLSDALAIDLKGLKVIGPEGVFLGDVKSRGVSDGQGIFLLLVQGDMASGMAGSIVNGPYNPCPNSILSPPLRRESGLKE